MYAIIAALIGVAAFFAYKKMYGAMWETIAEKTITPIAPGVPAPETTTTPS